MKTRAIVMLGLALLLAGASVYLARSWLQNQVQPVVQVAKEPKVEMTKVVVAAGDLQFGNKLRREHLRVVDWPKAALPEGSFKSIDEVISGKQGEERVVLRPIAKNEPVLKSKVTGFGGRASLSTLISPGMRAATIRVNDVNGVAGFVLPGDRVDIMLTRDPTGGKSGPNNLITDILLQNMKVLGIDQDANEARDKPAVVKAVTLEVTPLQAQKLTLAQKLGTLSLALRHVTTVDAEQPQTVTVRDLRVGEANQAPDPLHAQAAKSTKKPTVSRRVAKKTRREVSSVRIVRGLTAKEYEVLPEKPEFSAPAYSKPLNLLPTKLPQAAMPGAPEKPEPAKDQPTKDEAAKTSAPAQPDAALAPPIKLLKEQTTVGQDG
jgi:pilus assembly protein CpaB